MSTPTWLRRFHPSPTAAAQLVCFPHAGGSATAFFPHSRELRSSIEVLAVQYPGRQERIREPFAGSVHEVADGVAEELLPLMQRPTALFGHSMGAVVAGEVAHRLTAGGAPPLGVFVSGRPGPAEHKELRHLLEDEELLNHVRRISGEIAGPLDNSEFAALFLPLIRADYRIVETYDAAGFAPLDCPVVVVNGAEDDLVTAAQSRAWAPYCAAGMQEYRFPGGHFYLTDQPEPVLRMIRGTMARLLHEQPFRRG